MDRALEGRVAIVTGAAGGIGRAIALQLAAAGAQVAVADLQDGGGRGTVEQVEAAGGTATAASCDVSDDSAVAGLVEATVQRFARLDVLVNNAGIGGDSALLHELDVADWDRVVAVNLRGPFLCTRYAVPHLLAAGSGSIVNIASTYGLIGAPLAGAYCASKGAVVNLTRQLAVDYGPLGLRVNAICPGYVDTDMGGYRASLPPEQAAEANVRREAGAGRQPLGRQAHADEIARVAAFLASDASSFMTGAVVPVDGGCTATFNHGE